jgi:hypothetical protein
MNFDYFKLSPLDNADNYQASFLINAIMQELYNNGWLFIAPIRTSRDQGDLNALYFRYDESLMKQNEQARIFAISLTKNDRIRLINAPDQLTNSIRVLITETWPKGTQ